MIRTIILCSFLFFCLPNSHAQNLTGTWEGTMDGNEKIHVYIQMKKNELCGYTWDYSLNDPSSFCKAVFKGWYDKEQEAWMVMGTHFMENSGNHILMLLRLWRAADDSKNTLSGTVESKSGAQSLLNMGGGRGRIRIRKISSRLPADMPDCFPEVSRPKNPVIKKEATVKPLPKHINPGVVKKAPSKPIAIPAKPQKKIESKAVTKTKDSVRISGPDTTKKITKVIAPPPVVRNDNAAMIKKMTSRKNKEFSHLIVHEKRITLFVYDNGVVDNDTVSIFYNGKLIAGRKGLSEKPLVLPVDLDDSDTHQIIMFAENLGSISPNTALIVITTGDKRYELHSSASLSENAVLTFEYKPK